MTPTDVPLGPEDQPRPDRDRQQRDPDGRAEHERRDRDKGRDDRDTWQTEATFGEDAVGDPGGPTEPDDVDPIVHRGE